MPPSLPPCIHHPLCSNQQHFRWDSPPWTCSRECLEASHNANRRFSLWLFWFNLLAFRHRDDGALFLKLHGMRGPFSLLLTPESVLFSFSSIMDPVLRGPSPLRALPASPALCLMKPPGLRGRRRRRDFSLHRLPASAAASQRETSICKPASQGPRGPPAFGLNVFNMRIFLLFKIVIKTTHPHKCNTFILHTNLVH